MVEDQKKQGIRKILKNEGGRERKNAGSEGDWEEKKEKRMNMEKEKRE